MLPIGMILINVLYITYIARSSSTVTTAKRYKVLTNINSSLFYIVKATAEIPQSWKYRTWKFRFIYIASYLENYPAFTNVLHIERLLYFLVCMLHAMSASAAWRATAPNTHPYLAVKRHSVRTPSVHLNQKPRRFKMLLYTCMHTKQPPSYTQNASFRDESSKAVKTHKLRSLSYIVIVLILRDQSSQAYMTLPSSTKQATTYGLPSRTLQALGRTAMSLQIS